MSFISQEATSGESVASVEYNLRLNVDQHVHTVLHSQGVSQAHALQALKDCACTLATETIPIVMPLRFLAAHFEDLKALHARMKESMQRKQLADIIALTATCVPHAADDLQSLTFCARGTLLGITDWGHEFIYHLEAQIIEHSMRPLTAAAVEMEAAVTQLVNACVQYDCEHRGEVQACDFLMEIDRLELLARHLRADNYERACDYLRACLRFLDELETGKIYTLVRDAYVKYQHWTGAMIIAVETHNHPFVSQIFNGCMDRMYVRQLAFIAGRQWTPVELFESCEDSLVLEEILNNCRLNEYFLHFANELDVMEPKTPNDVYKKWLDTGMRARPPRVLGQRLEAAREKLAETYCNAFVNCAFGVDKLVTADGGDDWVFHNKEHGMMAAAASLGLIYLWDVDGGLPAIDRYMYSENEHVKAGALLAIGVLCTRLRPENDPANALLTGPLTDDSVHVRKAATLAIGLANVGSGRTEVALPLILQIDAATSVELFAVSCLAAGMVSINMFYVEVPNAIIIRLKAWAHTDQLRSAYMLLAVLGLGFSYLGRRDLIDGVCESLEDDIPEPYLSVYSNILRMCAFAGTGDMYMMQKLVQTLTERLQVGARGTAACTKGGGPTHRKGAHRVAPRYVKLRVDQVMSHSAAVLAVGCIAFGEPLGADMCNRVLADVGQFGEPSARRAVPLAIAANYASRPTPPVIDALVKYAHDSDEAVACNACFALGIVGAGTNNARVAAALRQLAVFHARTAGPLYVVRLAQGLVHLGKGTLSLCPLHCDSQLVDYVAVAGLLVSLVAMLDPHPVLLGNGHYLLTTLTCAIQPRWLLTVDEQLCPLNGVRVRIGEPVDTAARAGSKPNRITGMRTQYTPVLLAPGERVELDTRRFTTVGPILEGICIMRERPDVYDDQDGHDDDDD